MTCIVLVQNPQRGGIMAITEGDEEFAQWPDHDTAAAAVKGHRLIEAWGGYVVDLENLEVRVV